MQDLAKAAGLQDEDVGLAGFDLDAELLINHPPE
jgi:hypothetical protein